MTRPLIIVPARLAASASVLRFAAEVNARKLLNAVHQAGGEPLTVHPDVPDHGDLAGAIAAVADRFAFADGLLLPGGGDIDPARYGGQPHSSVYGVETEQDVFDLALAHWAGETGIPTLAICRGLQVVNTARGGNLVTDMAVAHRELSELTVHSDSRLHDAAKTDSLLISCYHHQMVDTLGSGLRATAWAADSTIEAVELDSGEAPWFLGLQWHPEDTAGVDTRQANIFAAFVAAAAAHATRRERVGAARD